MLATETNGVATNKKRPLLVLGLLLVLLLAALMWYQNRVKEGTTETSATIQVATETIAGTLVRINKLYYLVDSKRFKEGVSLVNASQSDLSALLDKQLDQQVKLSGFLQHNETGDSLIVLSVNGQAVAPPEQATTPATKQLFGDLFNNLTDDQQQCVAEKFGSEKLETLKALEVTELDSAVSQVMIDCLNVSAADERASAPQP